MKRSVGDVSIEVKVVGQPDFWLERLTGDQRNDIRDRLDAVMDDLLAWCC
jgi:hypothetical protein